jgi:hypothetical protein
MDWPKDTTLLQEFALSKDQEYLQNHFEIVEYNNIPNENNQPKKFKASYV